VLSPPARLSLLAFHFKHKQQEVSAMSYTNVRHVALKRDGVPGGSVGSARE
jgi:hypothetical protein